MDAGERCDIPSDNVPDLASCMVAPGALNRVCCVACADLVEKQGVGSLVGQVRVAAGGGAVAGAVVSVEGTPLTTLTDAEGQFTLGGVPAGERVLLNVTGPLTSGTTYSTTQLPVGLGHGETVRVGPRLLTGCAGTAVSNGSGLRVFSAACGQPDVPVSVTLPENGLVGAGGAAFTGAVRVEAVPLPVSVGGEPVSEALAAFPGDMSALDAGGQAVMLESFGALEVRLTDEATGAPLQLAQGARATITFPAGTRLPGETTPLWWFDVARGVWVEEGTASVEVDAQAQRVARAEVSHFTWWNSDQPATRGCMCGRAVLPGGEPVAYLQVLGTGVDYLGTSPARTGADGRFCMMVRTGSLVTLNAREPVRDLATQRVRTMRRTTVPTPPDTTSCTPGNEQALGDLVVDEETVGICVTGQYIDVTDAPAAGVSVRVRTSGAQVSVLTQQDGRFCANVPAGPEGVTSALRAVPNQARQWERASTGFVVPEGSVGAECGGPQACVDQGTLRLMQDVCMSGRTLDEQGNPVGDVLVEASGGTLSSRWFARSAPDGTFCLPVEGSATFNMRFSRTLSLLGPRAEVELTNVRSHTATGACGGGGCTSVGDVRVTQETCVSGRVVDGSGNPVAGARVEVREPVTHRTSVTTSGADGRFCGYAPQEASVEVHAQLRRLGARLASLQRGIAVGTGALECGSPSCTDAGDVVMQTYAPSLCVRGTLTTQGLPYTGPFSVGAGVDGTESQLGQARTNAAGRFCLDVPLADRVFLRREDMLQDMCTAVDFPLPSTPPEGSCGVEGSTCVEADALDFERFCSGS